MQRTRPLGFLGAVLCASLSAQAVYVDSSAAGANNGGNWTDAYVDLQSALVNTSAGEIWVAAGTYYPGAAGATAATFQLQDNVQLFGGFDGTEVQLAQRDVQANTTTLSGDIDQNDTYGPNANWWQFQWSGSLGNSWHVVTGSGTSASAVLDGFRIASGRADDPALRGGAGLLVVNGSPTFRNCTWQYNAVGYGSSGYLDTCDSQFENCVIKDAYTCNCGAGGWVSGFLCTGVSTLSFTDCEFTNHYYVSSSSQGRGAALRLESGCTTTLLRCRFAGNQTGNFYAIGGGTARGAALSNHGTLVVDQCEFVDNFAHAGAGISNTGPMTLTNSLFARNRAVSHANGSGFEDGDYGAGLLLWGFSAQPTVISNCTFVDNDCDKGAGVANFGASTPLVSNCIIYHNTGPSPTPGEDPVWPLKRQIVGSMNLLNSCVAYLFQTEPEEDPVESGNFPGCFDVDPQLVDVSGGDYRLTALSSCVNTGDMSAAVGMTNDLDGNARVMGLVDMGGYEFGGTALPSLVSTNFIQDVTAQLRVVNAAPNELAIFVWNTAGVGAGPCLPGPASLCLQLLPPFAIASWGLTDGFGHASTWFPVPPMAPLIHLHFQALMLRGVNFGNSVATNTLSWAIQPTP